MEKYNTNVSISINDIGIVIENLNNAGFDDFASVLNMARNETEGCWKFLAATAFNYLDHDRNDKIDKNDINQKLKEIKQAVQAHFRPGGPHTEQFDESPLVTVYHFMSLVPQYIAAKYIGLVGY